MNLPLVMKGHHFNPHIPNDQQYQNANINGVEIGLHTTETLQSYFPSSSDKNFPINRRTLVVPKITQINAWSMS